MTATAQLDRAFAALADPTRRAILARLSTGEASVTELAAPFQMSQPAISKHLKVLERAGLISRGRDAQRRPCRLDPRGLRAATDWLDDYRRLWERRYRRLKAAFAGDVALYSAHLPLDCHPEVGNNVLLARHLGLVPSGPFGRYKTLDVGLHGVLELERDELVKRLTTVLGSPARLIPGVPSPIGYVQALSSPLVFTCVAAATETWPNRAPDRSLKPR